MGRAPRTREQIRAVRVDRELHRSWLKDHGIEEPTGRLGEVAYTGVLLGTLLDPDARTTVAGALLDGTRSPGLAAGLPLTLVSAPTSIIDLVLGFGHQLGMRVLLIEHKRFISLSNAPGWRRVADADWQTDQAYEGALADELPSWLSGVTPGQVEDFLLLDAFGRGVDQLYNGGQHNAKWRVLSYAQLGTALRTAHDGGVRGLVPLLALLHADSD